MRTVSDHIYDIAYNSVTAESSLVKLYIEKDEENKEFKFLLEDNGPGIDKLNLEKIYDPFFTTRDKKIRKVGLGIPLLKLNTELTKGFMEINSEIGKGTKTSALFKYDSINMIEIGDLKTTIVGLLTISEKIKWEIYLETNTEKEQLTSQEIIEILGIGIPLNSVEVMSVLNDIVSGIIEGLEIEKIS